VALCKFDYWNTCFDAMHIVEEKYRQAGMAAQDWQGIPSQAIIRAVCALIVFYQGRIKALP
jgi:hypothetical protein